jgi:hypothetical protein
VLSIAKAVLLGLLVINKPQTAITVLKNTGADEQPVSALQARTWWLVLLLPADLHRISWWQPQLVEYSMVRRMRV